MRGKDKNNFSYFQSEKAKNFTIMGWFCKKSRNPAAELFAYISLCAKSYK